MSEHLPQPDEEIDAQKRAYEYVSNIDEADGIGIFQTDVEPLQPVVSDEEVYYPFAVQKEPNRQGWTAHFIAVADFSRGEAVGFGEMICETNETGELRTNPSVVYTQTEPQYLREGYGRKRLIAMNSIALDRFRSPLQSDVNMTDEAKHTWESLVRDGLAVAKSNTRYVFVSPT